MHQAVKLGQEGDAADSADGVNPQEEVPRVSFFFSNYNHQEQSFFFFIQLLKTIRIISTKRQSKCKLIKHL